MSYYLNSIHSLVQSVSFDAYSQELLKLTTTWSQPFAKYWIETVHPVISRVGSWEERAFGGELLTSNASESFNATLKRVQQWKEAPIDAMVLVLYRMAHAFDSEIQRGHVGLGDYKLRSGLSPQSISASVPSSMTFDDIVDKVRAGPSALSAPASTPSQQPSSNPSSPSLAEHSSTASSQQQSSDVEPDEDVQAAVSDYSQATVHERAKGIIASGKIALDSKLAVFTVVGTTEPRVVKLFPKTTCSCPA